MVLRNQKHHSSFQEVPPYSALIWGKILLQLFFFFGQRNHKKSHKDNIILNYESDLLSSSLWDAVGWSVELGLDRNTSKSNKNTVKAPH